MKKLKTILKICCVIIAIMAVAGNYIAKNEQKEMLCRATYYDFDSEVNAAVKSEGLDRLAHLQAAHINLEMLYQKDCCRYDETCPAGVAL